MKTFLTYFIVLVSLASCSLSADYSDGPTPLGILLSDSSVAEMSGMRDVALEQGVILKKQKKWFPAQFVLGTDTVTGKLRFKGDWTDHLQGDAWSYKIRLDQPLGQLRNFSIHKPETKNYLDEWLMHKALEGEGLLTTRYDFQLVRFNSESKGIYAVEEEIDTHFLSSRNLKGAPLFKLDEKPLWKLRKKFGGTEPLHLPYEQLLPVKIMNFSADSAFVTSAQHGLDVIRANRFLEVEAVVDYDVPKLAKQLALNSLFDGQHGLQYHNLRWLRNGGKMELIMQDVFSTKNENKYIIIDQVKNNRVDRHNPFLACWLANDSLRKCYQECLGGYLKDRYVDSLLQAHQLEINKWSEAFAKEGDFVFDEIKYETRRQHLQNKLPSFRSEIPLIPKDYTALEHGQLPEKYSVVVANSLGGGAIIQNYHVAPVIVSQIITEDDTLTYCDTLSAFSMTNIEPDTMRLGLKVKKVYFRLVDDPALHRGFVHDYQ